MNQLLLILAIVCLTFAHFVKIIRQSQFIEIYEKPPMAILSKALSITFALNLILPFKLGNIFRIIYTGKNLKNGKSFSFATIIIDMLLDFITITIIYLIFLFLRKNVENNVLFYFPLTILFFIFIVLIKFLSIYIKKVILYIGEIFNQNIELKYLKTIWYSSVSFQDMIKRINKSRLLLYTLISNSLYLLSYLFLSRFFETINIKIEFMNIFNLIYGKNNLLNPTLVAFKNYFTNNIIGFVFLFIFIVVPIVLIYLLFYFYKNLPIKDKNEKKYIQLFPYIDPHDRLIFLEKYFSNDNIDFLEQYLKINRDVAIIQDYSTGSNATTILCNKNDKTFFRKYSIGNDAEKLYKQIQWIDAHKGIITLTETTNVYYNNNVCSYDMPYIQDAVTCFNYVHTMPFENSWNNLELVLNEIDIKLHSINRKKADHVTIQKYIEQKVNANIKKIKNGQYIKPLLKYKYIYINGKKYHNLDYFIQKYLNEEYLFKIFKNDYYSDIHGDLTIENIVCIKEKQKNQNGYYIIDPNPDNLHNSPYLDYAKLLQSLHGGYEFLMKTKSVQYYENKIDFLFTKSNIYYKLFEKYVDYLQKKFGKEGLKSIFLHEIIHWLRLMPYKINKIGENSLLFYAGLIMVASDVEERIIKNETCDI